MSSRERIDQLDGLRGLAIILVVLNHIRSGPLFAVTPAVFHPLLDGLFQGGKTGVAILFLLSGFLMATLYPIVPSKLEFWQKRYTRILPAFVGMCTALWIIRWWVKIPLWLIPIVILGVLWLGGTFWRWLQRQPKRAVWGKRIFLSFLGLQGLMAISYLLLQYVVPAPVFYQLWPNAYRQLVFYLTNVTMTLPFGNYAPQLDGVYWSVIAEILFYLLYPVLVIPLVRFVLSVKSKVFGFGALLLLLPFIYGLVQIFHSVWGLSILQIDMGLFFVFGAIVGYVQHSALLHKWRSIIERIPGPLLITLIGLTIWASIVPAVLTSIDYFQNTSAWILPLSLVFIVTLGNTNLWSRWLSSRWLRWLGEMSYSIYLTHTIAIEMWLRNGEPKTLWQMVIAILLALPVVAILTLALHHFLELPYFNRQRVLHSVKETVKIDATQIKPPKARAGWPLLIIGLTVIVLVWLGYHVPVSLTAFVENHHEAQLPSSTPLGTTPTRLKFVQNENNFGMMTVHLQSSTGQGSDADAAVIVKIEDDTGHTLVESHFPMFQLFDPRFLLIGFPVQPDSAGKSYVMSVSVSNEDTVQHFALVNDGVTFRTVSFPGKSSLLAQPATLARLAITRLAQPFTEPSVLLLLLWCAPFVLWTGAGAALFHRR